MQANWSTSAPSSGTVQVIAADNSTCDWRQNTNMYHYYDGTRNPTPNGRRCEDAAYEDPDHPELGNIDLQDFIAYSNNQIPVTKDFNLSLYLPNSSPEWPDINAPFTGHEDPPHWIPETKKQQAWR